MNSSHGKADASVIVHPYETVSKRLRTLKLVLVFVLIAFLLGGLFVLRDEFTAENLRFLLRDLDLSTPSLGLDASALSFDYDTSQTAALYHGDLALLRRSMIEVYSFSGNRSLSEEVALSSPALICTDKYMLAYDIGGTHLSVYNSFSELFTETYEYGIFAADCADDGTFAVVTAEKGYHSTLIVYNSDFEPIFRYRTAQRVVYDMKLCRENPGLVALATVSAQGGDYLSELLLLDTRKEEIVASASFPAEMPLSLSFERDEALLLLTDSALHYLDSSLNERATERFQPEELASFYAQDGYAVLCKNAGVIGTTLEVLVLPPERPAEPLSFPLATQVQDLAISDSSLYLLSYDRLTVFSLHSSQVSEHTLDHEYKQILPLSGGRIAFVGEGSVTIYMVG